MRIMSLNGSDLLGLVPHFESLRFGSENRGRSVFDGKTQTKKNGAGARHQTR